MQLHFIVPILALAPVTLRLLFKINGIAALNLERSFERDRDGIMSVMPHIDNRKAKIGGCFYSLPERLIARY